MKTKITSLATMVGCAALFVSLAASTTANASLNQYVTRTY